MKDFTKHSFSFYNKIIQIDLKNRFALHVQSSDLYSNNIFFVFLEKTVTKFNCHV